MVQLWSSGRSHLISEGAHTVHRVDRNALVVKATRRSRDRRQDRNDLCIIAHYPSPPLAAKCRTGRGPARAFPAVAGSVLWGGAVLHQFFKVQIVQGGLAGCSGGSSAIRRWYCAAKHGRCSRRIRITSYLSLCGWCIRRPPSGTQWFCLEMLHPDRTGCVYRIYGPGRSPRHCGSRSHPAPGSG